MDPLVDEAWRIYRETQDDCVVRPSIPILYFGDSQRYQSSPLKVITVALNPSRHEFPVSDRFARFRATEHIIADNMDRADRTNYLSALDGYFRNLPYRSWFDWFDHVLRGIGASYYAGEGSVALHTDLCSPLATDPTWSKLGGQQEVLIKDGMALWHQLVEHLSPDVIVVSVSRLFRDRISIADQGGWHPLITIPRKDPTKRPYQALLQRASLASGKETLLVFGQAAQQPFATLTQEARRRIGTAVRESVHAG
ncbi:MAG: hypothetical protein ACRDJC_05885 [Thermomicrobiales bacterium]